MSVKKTARFLRFEIFGKFFKLNFIWNFLTTKNNEENKIEMKSN